ncbi:MAG: bile acid:sodium symporter family protein [Dermatophilus congolensis]|nr:bile acid:sodium symporter family protein [Dermatophilus congolensis]
MAAPSTRRFLPKFDGFILSILVAVLVASVLPAGGVVAEAFDWVVKVAIALLFFMYGGRLEPREALAGLRHWRLHLVILAFTFAVFPLIGQAMRLLEGWLLPEVLLAGMLYLCVIPSTVQSSIAFTSIAKGNVAGAIVSASASNLIGVVLTPLLVALTMGTAGHVALNFGAVWDLVLQILLPFVLGQFSRPWTAGWLQKNKNWLKYVDRGIIVAVVYSAFSRGMREGMWSLVGLGDLLVLLAVVLVLLAFMLWLTSWAARRLGFNREDRIAIQFCGTKKSLATGLPMALVLFPGQPVGLLVLPMMVFHQVQLMACSVLAARYAREKP